MQNEGFCNERTLLNFRTECGDPWHTALIDVCKLSKPVDDHQTHPKPVNVCASFGGYDRGGLKAFSF